jgi:hypothetical protein
VHRRVYNANRRFLSERCKILIEHRGIRWRFMNRGGQFPLPQPLTNALPQPPDAERHDRLEMAHALAALYQAQVTDQTPGTTAHARKTNAARKLYEHRMTMHSFLIPSILDAGANLHSGNGVKMSGLRRTNGALRRKTDHLLHFRAGGFLESD